MLSFILLPKVALLTESNMLVIFISLLIVSVLSYLTLRGIRFVCEILLFFNVCSLSAEYSMSLNEKEWLELNKDKICAVVDATLS